MASTAMMASLVLLTMVSFCERGVARRDEDEALWLRRNLRDAK
jgi:hypothetical protein